MERGFSAVEFKHVLDRKKQIVENIVDMIEFGLDRKAYKDLTEEYIHISYIELQNRISYMLEENKQNNFSEVKENG